MKKEVSNLSTEIREKTKFHHTSKSLKEFNFDLANIDIKDFIVYNFKNQNGTWLEDLLLSTFEYWKELNYSDWAYIFKKIERNELGEYYMTQLSKVYLGIDPKFKNSKGIRERLFPNRFKQKEKNFEFIGNINSNLFESAKEKLESNYIKVESLTANSNKLLRQMNESKG